MKIDDLFIDTPTFAENGCWFEITDIREATNLMPKIITIKQKGI